MNPNQEQKKKKHKDTQEQSVAVEPRRFYKETPWWNHGGRGAHLNEQMGTKGML